jgi:hypothetical protein
MRLTHRHRSRRRLKIDLAREMRFDRFDNRLEISIVLLVLGGDVQVTDMSPGQRTPAVADRHECIPQQGDAKTSAMLVPPENPGFRGHPATACRVGVR